MGAFKFVRTTADSGVRRGPRDFVITRAYVNAIRYLGTYRKVYSTERHDGLFDIYNFNRNASTTRII